MVSTADLPRGDLIYLPLRLRQDFDGDEAIGMCVAGFVNHTIPPSPSFSTIS
jgi:hypothetical protein